MAEWVQSLWYAVSPPRWLLPLSGLFGLMVRWRRNNYLSGRWFSYRSRLPIVIVGNITVGGAGKSPLTSALVRELVARGFRPVILSRGYGGHPASLPLLVACGDDPAITGDEPLMLARLTGVPVVVDPDRVRAVRWIESQALGDVVVCDDGLQHYRLARDVELVVLDGQRGLGNGALLPAGPLREPVSRLMEVNHVIVNGASFPLTLPAITPTYMQLKPVAVRQLTSGCRETLDWLQGRQIHALAGIGHPERFFASLRQLGAQVDPHPLPDHACREDYIVSDTAHPLVMTEKDAVKCEALQDARHWVLEIEAILDPILIESIVARLRRVQASCSGI